MGSETKWTPGPWSRIPGVDAGEGVSIQDSRNVPVARCAQPSVFANGDVKTISAKERNANANLIAAAPEMYDIAERMAELLNQWGSPIVAEWNAVAAKARGES